MILAYIQAVPDMKLDHGTGYPDEDFWFTSVTPSK
jgi:hypothetical protein